MLQCRLALLSLTDLRRDADAMVDSVHQIAETLIP